jgi:hypothetical protein
MPGADQIVSRGLGLVQTEASEERRGACEDGMLTETATKAYSTSNSTTSLKSVPLMTLA